AVIEADEPGEPVVALLLDVDRVAEAEEVGLRRDVIGLVSVAERLRERCIDDPRPVVEAVGLGAELPRVLAPALEVPAERSGPLLLEFGDRLDCHFRAPPSRGNPDRPPPPGSSGRPFSRVKPRCETSPRPWSGCSGRSGC